jgi:hypothetical protein
MNRKPHQLQVALTLGPRPPSVASLHPAAGGGRGPNQTAPAPRATGTPSPFSLLPSPRHAAAKFIAILPRAAPPA